MRDRKNKTPTEKTAALRITHSLTKETLQLMNREKVFPKKARWQICYELAEIVNKYHTCVMFANGINVDCHALFVLRHINVACAQAWLYVLTAKMSLAVDVLEINADKLENWAGLHNEATRCMSAWKASDKRRYSPKHGELTDADLAEAENAVRRILADTGIFGSVMP